MSKFLKLMGVLMMAMAVSFAFVGCGDDEDETCSGVTRSVFQGECDEEGMSKSECDAAWEQCKKLGL